VNGIQVILPWSAWHDRGTIIFEWPPFGFAAITDLNLPTLMTLASINMTTRGVPNRLTGLAFDDPEMITAYKDSVDAFLAAWPFASEIIYFSLGTDVDSYLKDNPEEWPQFKTFVETMAAHFHENYPSIQVGVTTTSLGALGDHKSEIQALNEVLDVWISTHYGTTENLESKPPEKIHEDLKALVAIAGKKPLVIQEIGYPSAELLGSTEEKQAEFVTELFAAWKTHGAKKIPFLSYSRQKDWLPAYCHFELCGINVDENGFCISPLNEQMAAAYDRFIAFLCSLGLHDSDAQAKAGWNAFVEAVVSLGL
jgi:hypothetical protein